MSVLYSYLLRLPSRPFHKVLLMGGSRSCHLGHGPAVCLQGVPRYEKEEEEPADCTRRGAPHPDGKQTGSAIGSARGGRAGQEGVCVRAILKPSPGRSKRAMVVVGSRRRQQQYGGNSPLSEQGDRGQRAGDIRIRARFNEGARR